MVVCKGNFLHLFFSCILLSGTKYALRNDNCDEALLAYVVISTDTEDQRAEQILSVSILRISAFPPIPYVSDKEIYLSAS